MLFIVSGLMKSHFPLFLHVKIILYFTQLPFFRPFDIFCKWSFVILRARITSDTNFYNKIILLLLCLSPVSSAIFRASKTINGAVPTAYILGGPEYFISKVISLINSPPLILPLTCDIHIWIFNPQGSTINLTCIIKYTPDAPSHTFWHFKDKVRASKGQNTAGLLIVLNINFIPPGTEFWNGAQIIAIHWKWRNVHQLFANQRRECQWFGKICLCTVECRAIFHTRACCKR